MGKRSKLNQKWYIGAYVVDRRGFHGGIGKIVNENPSNANIWIQVEWYDEDKPLKQFYPVKHIESALALYNGKVNDMPGNP